MSQRTRLIAFLLVPIALTLIISLANARAKARPQDPSGVFFAPELIATGELTPAGVRIRGVASLLNTKHPMRLGWALSVSGTSGTKDHHRAFLQGWKYELDEFILAKDVELTPTFDQVVELPPGPGLYFAQLLLYESVAEGEEEDWLLGNNADIIISRTVTIPVR